MGKNLNQERSKMKADLKERKTIFDKIKTIT